MTVPVLAGKPIPEPTSSHPDAKKTSPTTKKAPVFGVGQSRYIRFWGDAGGSAGVLWFDVLAGEQPPTITGGYANWQEVARPLRRALTVFQGYSPIIMEMGVRLMHIVDGSWDRHTEQVEQTIAKLEVLAGTGYSAGPPAFVYLATFNERGDTTPLIPFLYQETETRNVPINFRNHSSHPWIITGLQWDTAPVRNSDGFRVRQDAHVTVQLFEGGAQAAPSVAHHQEKSLNGKALQEVSSVRADTPLALAAATGLAASRVALAKAIIAWPGNKQLHLRSISQRIPHGRRVWIPFNY